MRQVERRCAVHLWITWQIFHAYASFWWVSNLELFLLDRVEVANYTHKQDLELVVQVDPIKNACGKLIAMRLTFVELQTLTPKSIQTFSNFKFSRKSINILTFSGKSIKDQRRSIKLVYVKIRNYFDRFSSICSTVDSKSTSKFLLQTRKSIETVSKHLLEIDRHFLEISKIDQNFSDEMSKMEQNFSKCWSLFARKWSKAAGNFDVF